MRIFHHLAAALLALFLTLPAQAAEETVVPDAPSETAMAFAGQFSDAHLSGMLSRVGGRSAQMQTLSQLNGQLVAAVFDSQIDSAVEKYGDEWQRNLAVSWGELLDGPQMESLMLEGLESPHAAAYKVLSPKASKRMGELSSDLFKEILTEVIGKTMVELSTGQAN